MKKDENLGIRLGTKRQSIFEELREATKIQIEGQEKSLEANREILKMCERIISEEKQKLK